MDFRSGIRALFLAFAFSVSLGIPSAEAAESSPALVQQVRQVLASSESDSQKIAKLNSILAAIDADCHEACPATIDALRHLNAEAGGSTLVKGISPGLFQW